MLTVQAVHPIGVTPTVSVGGEAEHWPLDPCGTEGVRGAEANSLANLLRSPIAEHLDGLVDRVAVYLEAARELAVGAQDFVLDASCGEGYGSRILAGRSGRVVGLDVNERLLGFADREFRAENLSFETYDRFQSGRRTAADKAVCADTLPQLPADRLWPFLEQLMQALKGGGDVWISYGLPDQSRPSAPSAGYYAHEPAMVQALLSNRFEEACWRVNPVRNPDGSSGRRVTGLLRGHRRNSLSQSVLR